jgi:hypothetical protein
MLRCGGKGSSPSLNAIGAIGQLHTDISVALYSSFSPPHCDETSDGVTDSPPDVGDAPGGDVARRCGGCGVVVVAVHFFREFDARDLRGMSLSQETGGETRIGLGMSKRNLSTIGSQIGRKSQNASPLASCSIPT